MLLRLSLPEPPPLVDFDLLILMFSQSICFTARSTDGRLPCLLGTYLQWKVEMSRFCCEIHCTRFDPYGVECLVVMPLCLYE